MTSWRIFITILWQLYEYVNSKYKDWKQVVGYLYLSPEGPKDGNETYGNAILVTTGCMYESSVLSADIVQFLVEVLLEFEKKAKYKLGISLYLLMNVGLCWHKIGSNYDDKAVEAFKKYIFYSLSMSNHISYRPVGYHFKSITDYLLKSLEEETINLSAPATFNDVYDCPILELLRTKGDDVSQLINQAYRYTVKVACFVCNVMLPSFKDFDHATGNPIKKFKPDSNTPEYLKELMWGYYADSQKGVCLQYHFGNNMSHFAGEGQF